MACQSYGYKLHVQRTNLYGDTVYRGWMYWDTSVPMRICTYKGPILCTEGQSYGDTMHVQRTNQSYGCTKDQRYMLGAEDTKDQYGVQRTTRCMYRGPICMYGDTMCIYYAQSINVWVGTMYVHRTMQSYRDRMHVHWVNPMWTSGNCRKIHAIYNESELNMHNKGMLLLRTT